jgi:hypothetical protein
MPYWRHNSKAHITNNDDPPQYCGSGTAGICIIFYCWIRIRIRIGMRMRIYSKVDKNYLQENKNGGEMNARSKGNYFMISV